MENVQNVINEEVRATVSDAVSSVGRSSMVKTVVTFGLGVVTGVASCKIPKLIITKVKNRKKQLPAKEDGDAITVDTTIEIDEDVDKEETK